MNRHPDALESRIDRPAREITGVIAAGFLLALGLVGIELNAERIGKKIGLLKYSECAYLERRAGDIPENHHVVVDGRSNRSYLCSKGERIVGFTIHGYITEGPYSGTHIGDALSLSEALERITR